MHVLSSAVRYIHYLYFILHVKSCLKKVSSEEATILILALTAQRRILVPIRSEIVYRTKDKDIQVQGLAYSKPGPYSAHTNESDES